MDLTARQLEINFLHFVLLFVAPVRLCMCFTTTGKKRSLLALNNQCIISIKIISVP